MWWKFGSICHGPRNRWQGLVNKMAPWWLSMSPWWVMKQLSQIMPRSSCLVLATTRIEFQCDCQLRSWYEAWQAPVMQNMFLRGASPIYIPELPHYKRNTFQLCGSWDKDWWWQVHWIYCVYRYTLNRHIDAYISRIPRIDDHLPDVRACVPEHEGGSLHQPHHRIGQDLRAETPQSPRKARVRGA